MTADGRPIASTRCCSACPSARSTQTPGRQSATGTSAVAAQTTVYPHPPLPPTGRGTGTAGGAGMTAGANPSVGRNNRVSARRIVRSRQTISRATGAHGTDAVAAPGVCPIVPATQLLPHRLLCRFCRRHRRHLRRSHHPFRRHQLHHRQLCPRHRRLRRCLPRRHRSRNHQTPLRRRRGTQGIASLGAGRFPRERFRGWFRCSNRSRNTSSTFVADPS